LQFLQQALPLFANLIFSSANLTCNDVVRVAPDETPQKALLAGAEYRVVHQAKTAIATNTTGIKPPTMTHMRNVRSFAMARTPALLLVWNHTPDGG
jgi:hypothetical protein